MADDRDDYLKEEIRAGRRDANGVKVKPLEFGADGFLKDRREQGIRLINKVTGEEYRVPNENAAKMFFSSRGIYAGMSSAQAWMWRHPKDEPEEWAYRKNSNLPWGSWPGWEEAETFVMASVCGLEVEDVRYVLDNPNATDWDQANARPPAPAPVESDSGELGFQFVLGPLREGEDGIFPRSDVSLVAGYSTAGKSTWTYDVLDRQSRKEKVHGRQTFGYRYLVIMHDRGKFSLGRTFRRMKIDGEKFPHVVLTIQQEMRGDTWKVIEEIIERQTDLPEIVFIEGLDFWAPDMSKSQTVAPFLGELRMVAEKYNIALIGSVGCPKQKPKERYADPISQIIGSQAWARKTESVAVLVTYTEPDKRGALADDRDMHLITRNARPQRLLLRFNPEGHPRAGRLDEVKRLETSITPVDGEASMRSQFMLWALERERFDLAEAMRAFDTASYRSLNRWAGELEEFRKSTKRGERGAVMYVRKQAVCQ
jgi:hypothetical protein